MNKAHYLRSRYAVYACTHAVVSRCFLVAVSSRYGNGTGWDGMGWDMRREARPELLRASVETAQ